MELSIAITIGIILLVVGLVSCVLPPLPGPPIAYLSLVLIYFVKDRPADLGYFVGYIVTKNYYKNSLNKKQAIKEILTLDFADENATENFLKKSKYACE